MSETQSMAARNLAIGFEFEKYLIEHPELRERIPQGAHVVLLPQWDTELAEYNRKLAERHISAGEAVVFVRVGELAPEPPSRLREVAIEPATS